MHTQVYILGAGASKPDGVPLMNGFISEGTDNWDGDDSDTINDFFKFTKKAFHSKEYDNYPSKEWQSAYLDRHIGIEQVLSKAMELKDNNAEAIVKKFIHKTIQTTSSNPPSGRRYSRMFISNRIENDIKRGNAVTIVSFNYDDLLERAMLANNLSQSFSYRIQFKDITNFDSYEEGYKGRLKILKLHGSFNWLFCNHCKNIELCWFKEYEDKTFCNKCSQKESTPILVPPATNKDQSFKKYSNIFEPLWTEAEKALREANEIVIAGYSFREADTKARESIGRAIADNSNFPKLTIVDGNHQGVRDIIFKISGKNAKDFCQIDIFDCFEEFVETSVPSTLSNKVDIIF